MKSNKNISKEQIIYDLKKGSKGIFEQIFKDYYRDMNSFAYSLVMNKDVAEDIVQDVFTKLWKIKEDIDLNFKIEAFLFSTTKNLSLDYLKHLKVIDKNKDKLTEALIFSNTYKYETNNELLQKVRNCLAELSKQQQTILEMKIVKGLKYKEIANELNIKESTVHTHIKRAYKEIRDKIPFLYYFIKFI